MIKNVYAAYRGDRFVGDGTLVWYLHPSARKRVEKTEANPKRKSKGGIHLVLLEEH